MYARFQLAFCAALLESRVGDSLVVGRLANRVDDRDVVGKVARRTDLAVESGLLRMDRKTKR